MVNVPGKELLEAVRICGSLSGRDGDKFARAGLHAEKSNVVNAVGVRECGARIECRMDREIPFEDRTWFVGTVVSASKEAGHQGVNALLCDRSRYSLPGTVLGAR